MRNALVMTPQARPAATHTLRERLLEDPRSRELRLSFAVPR